MKRKSLLMAVLLALGIVGAKAEDTIRTFTFAPTDMVGISYGPSAIMTSTSVIDDTATAGMAHTVSGTVNTWTHFADSASFAEAYAVAYPATNSYISASYILNRVGVAHNPGTADDGFMFLAYGEQSMYSGIFNTYFSLPAVECPSNTQVVEVRLTQAYRKYYDRCFIDYKINGNWYSREINVAGVDCEINGSATYHPSYTMPAALASESNIELRFRAFSGVRGNAYGYCWAVDNVAIVSGDPDQWVFAPEHFLDGKYGVVPQGMQVPLTWFAPVRNTGVNTQTGVAVSMSHTSPAGAVDTFLQQGMPNLVPSATDFDTLVINPRGLYNQQGMNIPTYLYNPAGTGIGLPTSEAGVHSVQTTVSSDILSRSFNTYNYRVSTADAVGSYAWGHGNGVLVGGKDGFCYGYSYNGYVSTSASDSYYTMAGHQVLVRLAAGSTVPTDVTGMPWVIHGMEMTVAPGIDAAGTVIEPKLYQYEYDDNSGGSLFREISIGVISHTVSANELNTLDTGYLLPGQYNTIRIIFPAQPTLEPGGVYYLGYRLPNGANFALANTYEAYDTDLQPDGSTTTVQFVDDPQLAHYANTFKPDYNDVFVYAYRPDIDAMSWLYGGYNIHSWPMINMLVGPMMSLPGTSITFDCASGNSSVLLDDTYEYCNGVCNVGTGATLRFAISSSLGYRLDSIRVNGVIVASSGDFENTRQSIFDSEGNLTGLSSYDRYQLLLEDVTTETLVQVYTSPLPTHTVTVNCPDGVIASLEVPTSYGYAYVPACGTISYTDPATLSYHVYLPDDQMVDYLLIDGDTVRLNGSDYFYLSVDDQDHVVDIFTRSMQYYTATFVNEGGGYMYVVCGSNQQLVSDSVQFSDLIWTNGKVEMVSFLPTSDYYGQYCDATNAFLLHFYVDDVEIPLSSLEFYDNISEYGYLFYRYSYQLDSPHTFRAVYGPLPDTLCLAPDVINVFGITDTTADITWNGYSDNYHVVLQQLDANGNVAATEAFATDASSITLSDLLPGTDYRVYISAICSSDTIGSAYTSFSTTRSVTISLQNPDGGQMYFTDLNGSNYNISESTSFTLVGSSTTNATVTIFADEPGGQYYGVDSDTSVARLTHLFVDGQLVPIDVDGTFDWGTLTVSYSSEYGYYSYALTLNLSSSHTVLARFGSWYDSVPEPVIDTFFVAVSSTDTATGTVVGGGRYAAGSVVSLVATPAPCHVFAGWSDGNTDNPRQITVLSDSAFVVLFDAVPASTGRESATACDSYSWNNSQYTTSGTYTFETLSAAGCDSIATLDLTINYSTSDTLVVTATESYTWNGVTYSESGTFVHSATGANGCDSVVTLVLTIETPVVYATITVVSNNNAYGTVLGGGTYEMGAEVTLTAVPNEGYRFVGWQDGNTDNPRTVTAAEDATYVATFEAEVGIGDVEGIAVSLQPNPARGQVTLRGVEPGAEVTVVDMQGRTHSKFSTQNSEITLDVSQWPAGTYFVRIAGERQSAVRKLVVR